MSIILPLYIYPHEGAWDPLYSAVDKLPDLQFLVIINPHSGPGNNTLLDPNFRRELPRLNARENVRTIGYVRTGWTTRDLDSVLRDVATYASWAENTARNYALSGIFYDETPNKIAVGELVYMQRIDEFVKSQEGFRGVNYIVHNPGSIPGDPRLFSGADLIVVFEDSYSKYQLMSSSLHLDSNLQSLASRNINDYGRHNFAYIINAIPTNWTKEKLKEFVGSAKSGAQYFYLSNVDLVHEDVYSKFASNWMDFVNTLGHMLP